MNLNNGSADIYVPDGSTTESALARTTHLAIGAHQDDLEIMAYHGIAECYQSDKNWFTGVVTTNGAGSPRTGAFADCTDEDMQKIRQQEQRTAADIGEFSAVIQLLYPSSTFKNPDERGPVDDLSAIFRATRPDVVYLHNPADKHDTHIASLLRCISALRTLPAEQRPGTIYGCEVWRNLDWVCDEEKIALPVDRYPEVAEKLVEVFESQISGGKRYDLATAGRRLANATFYASHETDNCNALSFAIDLTPLVKDDSLTLSEFTGAIVSRFADDVTGRIGKFS